MRWNNPRSQALPGNARISRLRLAYLQWDMSFDGRVARRSLAGSAFPGGAWERGCSIFFGDFYLGISPDAHLRTVRR